MLLCDHVSHMGLTDATTVLAQLPAALDPLELLCFAMTEYTTETELICKADVGCTLGLDNAYSQAVVRSLVEYDETKDAAVIARLNTELGDHQHR